MRRLLSTTALLGLLAFAGTAQGETTVRFADTLPDNYRQGAIGMAPDFDDGLPAVPREYRAVWVATVANIDWPSAPGLSVEQQKEEAIYILDVCEKLNINAVIFQARPQKDALYKSDLEPWSYFLTGEQGKAPDPLYDPLEFWIEESHKRGMELHVWFNPYRAKHPSMRGELHESSVVNTMSDVTYALSGGFYWMDPAAQETQDHSVSVVMDVVRRYNVDGIHFDDYFYPYPDYNDGDDFPDDPQWEAYQEAGGTMSRDDWRRNAVDVFIERLYGEIKDEKQHVKFGLSPFGIWRPGNPPSIEGFDQHAVLYADARKWLREGWIDYYTPQLYWPTRLVPQSLPVLLQWWQDQNVKGRHMWPGIATFHVRDADNLTNARIHRTGYEFIGEIMASRAIVPEAPGQTHFSMRSLFNDLGGVKSTYLVHGREDVRHQGPYARKALVPPSPWLGDGSIPSAPRVSVESGDGAHTVSVAPAAGDEPFNWVVFTEAGGSWSYDIIPGVERSFEISATGEIVRIETSGQGLDVEETREQRAVTRIAVSAVDRIGMEGPRTIVALD